MKYYYQFVRLLRVIKHKNSLLERGCYRRDMGSGCVEEVVLKTNVKKKTNVITGLLLSNLLTYEF